MKVIIEFVFVVVLIGLINFIVTGKGDKLLDGKKFEKCAFCRNQTEYFCIEHKQ